jgi:hypothetical protein
MQELIDRLDKTEKQLDKENNLVMSSALFAAKSMALESLEKEKEQIIEAWDKRGSTIVPRYFLEKNINGEEYYNQTYNQNK